MQAARLTLHIQVNGDGGDAYHVGRDALVRALL